MKFYGSERPDGDYVTCEVTEATDEDVSAALSIFYFPGEVVPDSTDLQFDDGPLVCGNFASIAVEFACHDLRGESTCVTEQPETDADANDEEDAEVVSERSTLSRRAEAACDGYTLQCKNQYQSASGACASDYKSESFEVAGNIPDIWCTKPCTEEEKQVCKDKKCPKSKKSCEKSGYVDDCAKAVIKCSGSPVKMPEKSCTTNYMTPGFTKFCTKKKKQCVVYKEGLCELDIDMYTAYVKILTEGFGMSI